MVDRWGFETICREGNRQAYIWKYTACTFCSTEKIYGHRIGRALHGYLCCVQCVALESSIAGGKYQRRCILLCRGYTGKS